MLKIKKILNSNMLTASIFVFGFLPFGTVLSSILTIKRNSFWPLYTLLFLIISFLLGIFHFFWLREVRTGQLKRIVVSFGKTAFVIISLISFFYLYKCFYPSDENRGVKYLYETVFKSPVALGMRGQPTHLSVSTA